MLNFIVQCLLGKMIFDLCDLLIFYKEQAREAQEQGRKKQTSTFFKQPSQTHTHTIYEPYENLYETYDETLFMSLLN